MADIELDATLADPLRVDFLATVNGYIVRTAERQLQSLFDLLPFRSRAEGKVHVATDWIAIRIRFDVLLSVPTVDNADPPLQAAFEKAAAVSRAPLPEQLAGQLPSGSYDFHTFSYLGPRSAKAYSSMHLLEHVAAWLNRVVVPKALELNRERVLAAVPTPPQLDYARVSAAMWVLECEEQSIQGTAVDLAGVGLVTCEHVLGPTTMAFRAGAPTRRYAVRVRRCQATVDLAVLDIDSSEPRPVLPIGTADTLEFSSHIAIAGYPNYRIGDSGMFTPGLVVGFRPVAGVRRILTNAIIVAGASGGPAINAAGEVVGIAVTGADMTHRAPETENHGVVPIDALRLF